MFFVALQSEPISRKICLNHPTHLASPTAAQPSHPDWIHEVKQDGYRLIVSRDGDRVRLFTRNGYDWTSRYPLIVEAARRTEPSSSSSMARLCFWV